MSRKKHEKNCDFCNRSHKEVGPLVEGPGSVPNGQMPPAHVFICATCADSYLALAVQSSTCRKDYED